jgi:hypothetical protein
MFFEKEKESLKPQFSTRFPDGASTRPADSEEEDKGVTVIVWPTVREEPTR